jgi:hypothetical protein
VGNNLEHTVIPGKRVGNIGKFTTADMLDALYGRKQVQHKKLPNIDGELYEATFIHAGTEYELLVVWQSDAIHQRIRSVQLIGRAWLLDNGLKLGLTPAQVEKINGSEFTVNGFGWEQGGFATISKGTLSEGIRLRFAPVEKSYPDSLRGRDVFKSSNPILEKAQVVLSEMSIHFY